MQSMGARRPFESFLTTNISDAVPSKSVFSQAQNLVGDKQSRFGDMSIKFCFLLNS